jgi:hypothetical protein
MVTLRSSCSYQCTTSYANSGTRNRSSSCQSSGFTTPIHATPPSRRRTRVVARDTLGVARMDHSVTPYYTGSGGERPIRDGRRRSVLRETLATASIWQPLVKVATCHGHVASERCDVSISVNGVGAVREPLLQAAVPHQVIPSASESSALVNARRSFAQRRHSATQCQPCRC